MRIMQRFERSKYFLGDFDLINAARITREISEHYLKNLSFESSFITFAFYLSYDLSLNPANHIGYECRSRRGRFSIYSLWAWVEINLLLSLQPHNQFHLKRNTTAKSKDNMDPWEKLVPFSGLYLIQLPIN